jgi:hypothetical protein
MLEYNGYGDHVNSKPEGEWLEIRVQNTVEWNREAEILVSVAKYWTGEWTRTLVRRNDEWEFFAWISLDNYERDIEGISNLISRLKQYDDEEIFVKLIDFSEGLKEFFNWLYLLAWSPNCTNCAVVLNPEVWKEWLRSHQIKKRRSVNFVDVSWHV